ncbi:MAG: hypothetical protein ABL933_01675 [Methyloglobulus sp.]|nr:hypothetical protein [Methyloglobulus sp.]
MKSILILMLITVSPQSIAVEKCLVDGKVVYTQGVCTNGIPKDIRLLKNQIGFNSVIKKRQEEEQLNSQPTSPETIQQPQKIFTDAEIAELKRQAMNVPDPNVMSIGELLAAKNKSKQALKLLELATGKINSSESENSHNLKRRQKHITLQRFGDQTYSSDGTAYSKFGDITYGSDGSVIRKLGDTVYIDQ